jgi:DNA-binding transcriptional regulator YiaG
MNDNVDGTSETPEEQEARKFFEAVPLKANRIPTASTQTADYFVDGDAPCYAVEAKTRLDNVDALKALRQGKAVDERSSPPSFDFLRQHHRLMQEQFVHHLGVSLDAVNVWENGKSTPLQFLPKRGGGTTSTIVLSRRRGRR